MSNTANSVTIYGGDNNNIYTLDIIKNPIATLLNTSAIKIKKTSDKKLNVDTNLKLNLSSDIVSMLSDYGIKPTDFRIAITDENIDAMDLISSSTASIIGKPETYANLDTNTAKMVFGIPGIFTQTKDLNSELQIALPNITADPVILTNSKPFQLLIDITTNEKTFNLPKDFNTVDFKDNIHSTSLAVEELKDHKDYNDTPSLKHMYKPITSIKDLEIDLEGLYKVSVKVIDRHGIERIETKKLIVIDNKSIHSGLRLNNDSSVIITHKGLYDTFTKRYIELELDMSSPSTVNPITGIRLTNGNIAVIIKEAVGPVGEVFDSNLQHLYHIACPTSNNPLDLIEYNSKLYVAFGEDGLMETTLNSTERVLDLVKTNSLITTSANCLAAVNGELLIGTNDPSKVLTLYDSCNDKLALKDSLTANYIYGDYTTANRVMKLTIRGTELELYPGASNYHIVLELP